MLFFSCWCSFPPHIATDRLISEGDLHFFFIFGRRIGNSPKNSHHLRTHNSFRACVIIPFFYVCICSAMRHGPRTMEQTVNLCTLSYVITFNSTTAWDKESNPQYCEICSCKPRCKLCRIALGYTFKMCTI